jgi:hypothetical protein
MPKCKKGAIASAQMLARSRTRRMGNLNNEFEPERDGLFASSQIASESDLQFYCIRKVAKEGIEAKE